MYPTSMRINEEGRLVVNFKTEARFRGQFVMSHPGMGVALMHTHTHALNPFSVVILYKQSPIGLPCGPHPPHIYFWCSTLRVLPV